MDTRTALESSFPSSPSSSKGRWMYDVFLSFRGEDTRNTFTDHLYYALKQAGIKTFKDNQLRRGEHILSELHREIEGSNIAVIVFSSRYAESRWCLRELAKIIKCRNEVAEKIVYPIFYDVDTSHVRKQSGSFAEAFQKHEKDEDKDEVEQWRKALTDASELAGKNLKTTSDGREGKFIKKIVQEITSLLNPTYINEAKQPVGLDFRVQEISKLLDVGGSDDVSIIGIWGMGGMGKSTLAKAIFNKYNRSFDGCSFLEDVRKKQLVGLQEQLLKNILKRTDIKVNGVAEGIKQIEKRLGRMKVLVIIDDIDDDEQLDAFSLKPESFGPGSRIIITTRDEHVLNVHNVEKRYKAQGMTEDEALELLSWNAFGNGCPDKEYMKQAREVVEYCGGVPLALQVVGRLLVRKSISVWESTLGKLKNIPDRKILETLKISYDGLNDDHVKGTFLHISCFFIDFFFKDFVIAILDGCSTGFSVESEIRNLQDRCLVEVDEGVLKMHDLIRDMGRDIVRTEAKDPGKRSRLWHHEEVTDVLKDISGKKEVEGLCLDLREYCEVHIFSTEAFREMQRLKFLQLNYVKLTGNYQHLSKQLRWLCWHGFPEEVIPENFNQRNLVAIDLSYSKLVQVWEDSDLVLEKLKFLDVSHSPNLTRSPDFSKLPNLENLVLRGCKGLSGVDHCLLRLKNLRLLDLGDCNLTDDDILENFGSLSSLKILFLDGNGFCRLPILSGLSNLTSLCLDHCTNLQAIRDLPTTLKVLEANYCTELETLPEFSEMTEVIILHLKGCCKLNDIPMFETSSLDSMERIHMEGCTNLTAAFKDNILQGWIASGEGGVFLSGSDIPWWFIDVAGEDKIVPFEVPQSVIERLTVCIVYSSDDSQSVGSLHIRVANRTQKTEYSIWPTEAAVIASNEDYLWMGNISNKMLNLKGGDKVCVCANFFGTDYHFKVKKIGVSTLGYIGEYPTYKITCLPVPYIFPDTDDDDDDDNDNDVGSSHHSFDEDQSRKRLRVDLKY